MTRDYPPARTRIGVVAFGVGLASVGIAELTGNVLVFCLGGMVGIYGILVLVSRVAAGPRGRDSDLFPPR